MKMPVSVKSGVSREPTDLIFQRLHEFWLIALYGNSFTVSRLRTRRENPEIMSNFFPNLSIFSRLLGVQG